MPRLDEIIRTDLATGWSCRRLRFDCKTNPKKSEINAVPETEVSFIPMEAIEEMGGLDLNQVRTLDEVYEGYTYLAVGDVCVAKITPCFENGKGALASSLSNGIGFGTTELHVLRAKVDLSTRFLFYLSISQPLRAWGTAEMLGAGGQKRVPENFFKDWPLAKPNLEQQERIADFLDERTTRIDGLIAKKTCLLELLAEQRQALITRAVTKGLDPSAPMKPSGIDWLGDIPADWEVKRLKFLALVRISNVDKIVSEEEISISLCNYTDVYYNNVITSDLAFMQGSATIAEIERFKLRHDQVILTKDSESWDEIGIPAYVPHDLTGVVCGYHLAVITPDNEHLSGRYLSWLCRSESLNGQFKIAANGVTRFALGLYGIKNAEVFTPPLAVQEHIADYLDEQTAQIDHTVTKVQASVGLLREYRAALITAAVTGKLETRLPAAVTQPAARQAPAAFKRAVLAAYIADRMCDQATFGRVKFQKTLHLAEAHLGIDEVEGQYYRKAAGPFDPGMMRSVHSQFKQQGWIIPEDREGNKGTQYRRGAKIDAYKTYFDRYFGDKKEAIDGLLSLIGRMDTQQAEIVSTCFAAWNDLLIEGKNPSDDEIVNLIWNDWNESKRNIARKRWYDALGWMRSKGIVPQKRGKHTKKKAKK